MERNKLEKLRKEIDKIDNDLIKIIAKRFKITERVRDFKKENNLPIEDKNREAQILEKANVLAKKIGINSDLAKNILMQIISEAKK